MTFHYGDAMHNSTTGFSVAPERLVGLTAAQANADGATVRFQYRNDAGTFECVCPGGENGLNDCEHKNRVEGSIAFVPSVFGMTMASVAVKLLCGLPLPRSCDEPVAPRPTIRPSRLSAPS